MLYCVPVMLRSGKRPSIFALPNSVSLDARKSKASESCERSIPMLALSMKLMRYRTSSIGTSRTSILRSTTFFCSSENEARKPASSSVMLPLRTCSNRTTVVLSNSKSWSDELPTYTISFLMKSWIRWETRVPCSSILCKTSKIGNGLRQQCH
jgi:hypothetical protein